MQGCLRDRSAGLAMTRQDWLNSNFGLHPRASSPLPRRSPDSPRCSAAGVIFA